MQLRFHLSALLTLLAALTPGCATPENRAKEKTSAFDKLPSAQKKAALEGKVLVGMNPDAVWIAFGQPDRVKKNGSRESWIYTRPEFYEIPHWRYRCVQRHDGRSMALPEYDPLQFKRYVNDLEVIFKNGKVVDWKKL